MAAVVAAAGLTVLGPVGAAHASDSGCSGSYDFDTCISISGSGTHVNYIDATSVYENTADGDSGPFHVEIVGPQGHVCNSTTVNGPVETKAEAECDRNSNVATGEYCAITWGYFDGGYYENDGEECQPVN